eukprot:8106095-Pyramimonas_sp.AAC.1
MMMSGDGWDTLAFSGITLMIHDRFPIRFPTDSRQIPDKIPDRFPIRFLTRFPTRYGLSHPYLPGVDAYHAIREGPRASDKVGAQLTIVKHVLLLFGAQGSIALGAAGAKGLAMDIYGIPKESVWELNSR